MCASAASTTLYLAGYRVQQLLLELLTLKTHRLLQREPAAVAASHGSWGPQSSRASLPNCPLNHPQGSAAALRGAGKLLAVRALG